MATLMELCDSASSKTLQKISDRYKAERKAEWEAERKRNQERHKLTHIFDSYDEALDWVAENPDRRIQWHCDEIEWCPEKKLYRCSGQEYDFSGVIPYDVVRYRSREELLEGIERHKEYIAKLYPDDKEGFLDEAGKLEYVYVLGGK